jgi:cellulose synthase/poly-beta-1,6-N-acetylglucosamine synthase-like glycosyltransferase
MLPDWLLLISIAMIVYTWIGYPVILTVLAALRRRRVDASHAGPTALVSIIVPVHNEQNTIVRKIEDCLALDYPRDKIEIIIVSDNSADRTQELVSGYCAQDSRIRWIASDHRAGKSGVQNLAASHARGDLFFFTDASTTTSRGVLRKMIERFDDLAVGLVTATVLFGDPGDAIEKGQGAYWRYELLLRSLESDLGTLATGSGQALLVRRELFRPLPACYGDDCIMPLDVRLQGYRVVQDRDAVVFDTMPHSIEGELRARVRMTARNWAGTLSRPKILDPFRFPFTALGLVSHKLLRWLTPFFLGMVLTSSVWRAVEGRAVILLWLQAGFYFSAFVGWEFARKQRAAGVFGYAFSFCLANIGFLLGMIKAFRNQKIVAY